eukprot:3616448-Rhodomonas_salina.1
MRKRGWGKDHGVAEGLSRHDVGGLDVLLQQHAYRCRRCSAQVERGVRGVRESCVTAQRA